MSRVRRGATVLPATTSAEEHVPSSERAAVDAQYRQARADLDDRHALIAALVAMRDRAGLRQRDVARHMGVEQATVSEFENHSDDPHLSTLQRYARAVDARIAVTVEASGSWGASPRLYPTQRAAQFAAAVLSSTARPQRIDAWHASVDSRAALIAAPQYTDFDRAA